MNLYFVRHGETEYNKNKCYYGSLDVELTENGIIQAEKARQLIKDVNFSSVYISEKKRTENTAKILLRDKKYNFIKDKRINETNFGVFEGKSYEQIKTLYPSQCKQWCDDWKKLSPPGGESYIQLYKRVKEFMNDILKLNQENVLIVTHGGVIRSIYCYILGDNLDFFWKFGSETGDITIIKYEYDNLYIDSITHV
ncbi:alpha-ribazole phosphatase [Clostridium sp. DJ247]|uniref:alpha-ribazole phosphatase n=1 Tax=Clostridium sp. DJ247 TaxID=2726188 RepID=UPI001629F3E7|nr:alpha-ribazole phosphatase [Clostridium sp. DJ247]MBC2579807.1 alpha-ribazole phosphatase [Clostridium sp. DJ247]